MLFAENVLIYGCNKGSKSQAVEEFQTLNNNII